MIPTVLEVAEALADTLTQVSPSEELNVSPRMEFSPTPPAIDIYPATPSQAVDAFGPSKTYWFTIRLRVATSDPDGQQDFLYAALTPEGAESVEAALFGDTPELDAVADAVYLDPNTPSGFQLYEDSSGSAGAVLRYLGVEWRVAVMVSGNPDS